MPYIGNDIQYGELTSQTFTGDGSTVAFTMGYTVANPTSILVTSGNVVQEPTVAYTVAGTTLTFTSAPENADTIHVRYLGRTLDVAQTAIVQDADQDTKIQVEESADEDTIRFDIAGAEDFTMTANDFTALLGSTISTNTIAETTADTGVTIDGLLVKDGTAAFADGLVGTPAIGFADDLDTGFYRIGSNNIGLALSGALMYDFTTGGLTQTSPVATNAAETIRSTTASGSGAAASLILENGSGNTNAAVAVTGNDDILRLQTNNGSVLTDAVLIDGTQKVTIAANVGLGGSAATNPLTVAKAVAADYVGVFNNTNTGANAPSLLVATAASGASTLDVHRTAADGTLVQWIQGGSIEGTISVSGTTISYGTFTGGHWSQGAVGVTPSLQKGTVVSTIDEMCEWLAEEWTDPDEPIESHKKHRHDLYEGSGLPGSTHLVDGVVRTVVKEDNDQLVRCAVSSVVGDKRVYGVFSNLDDEGDAIINALGTYVVRVTGACAGGDLLESAGDGTARVQADDIIRSSTIGKVTFGDSETVDRLVPCVLYCG
jgi:hypothetical protein